MPSWGGPSSGAEPGENHEPGEAHRTGPCESGRNERTFPCACSSYRLGVLVPIAARAGHVDMEAAEIGFAACRPGGDAKAMWGIGEPPRRRRKVENPTAGAFSGPPDGVAARFRWPRIAARAAPCQETGERVSAIPYQREPL